MSALPIIFSSVSTGLTAIGQLNQGESEAQAAEYNAQVNDQNANASLTQSSALEGRQRILAKKQIGQARAAYGASGVQIEGTPEDVLGDSAAAAELDALTIRHAGEVRALSYRNEASLDRYRGRNSRLQGRIRAASTIFSALGGSAGGGGGKQPGSGGDVDGTSYSSIE